MHDNKLQYVVSVGSADNNINKHAAKFLFTTKTIQ
jgi:hypothetical protein